MGRIAKDSWLYTRRIAHRGLHDEKSAENSMSAFGKAIEAGYAIEIDVHVTKDNQVVIFHDNDLKRMCGADVVIEETDFKELRKYKLGGTEEHIPLLVELLRIAEGEAPLLIELKAEKKIGRLEQEVYAILRNYKGEFALQSFNPKSIKWFKKYKPEWVRGQLSCDYKDHKISGFKRSLLANCRLNFLTKPDFISYNIGQLPVESVTKFREKGGVVLGWTVRDQKTADEKAALVDNIIFENFIPNK